MLIIGEKYRFHDFEINSLKEKNIQLQFILIEDKTVDEILDQLQQTILTHNINLIVINTKLQPDRKIMQYLDTLQSKKEIHITTTEAFLEKYLQKCYIPEHNDDLTHLKFLKPYSIWQRIQKTGIDYFGLFWLFFFSWPVIINCRRRIKEQSPGKVIFQQSRIGLFGKPFQCKKFRTMHENSHHDPYTREQDSRIFSFGETMRKSRLDELPQMLNILKGEMHLIGPRAEWDILAQEYATELPFYEKRHLVKPGITGWAQVNYPYGKNLDDARQKLMYDLYYIKYWNIGLELKIVWMTAMTVIKKKGL